MSNLGNNAMITARVNTGRRQVLTEDGVREWCYCQAACPVNAFLVLISYVYPKFLI